MGIPVGVVEGRVGRTTEQIRVVAIHGGTEFKNCHESVLIHLHSFSILLGLLSFS